jgi:hypothetical protein
MEENKIIESDERFYKETVDVHALNWLKNCQHQNLIEYIEFNGGPLLANWISEFGAIKVARDIEHRINEELK